MSQLPKRFPKERLHGSLSFIESRVASLMDETQEKIEYAEEHGMGNVTVKLAQRFNGLDEIRRRVNEARLLAYDLV